MHASGEKESRRGGDGGKKVEHMTYSKERKRERENG